MSGSRVKCKAVVGPLPIAACAWLVSVWPLAISAGEIYRWTGADGVVHFSDTKPFDDTPFAVLELDIPEPQAYDAASDPYSIMNQAARIHETWIELEAVRQARIEARAAESADPAPTQYPANGQLSSYTYRPWLQASPQSGNPDAGRQQRHALDELDLLGPRPYSINSSAHRERVNRSQALPFVAPPPGPEAR
jgi:hypothetical protein